MSTSQDPDRLSSGAEDLLGLDLNLGLNFALDLPSPAPSSIPTPSSSEAQDPNPDLEGQVLQDLPKEAKPTFLRSLNGLTPAESHDYCAYLLQSKTEKQFRVIQAMSDSLLDGKRQFILKLKRKMEIKQRQDKELLEQEQRDLEEHRKRMERQDAVNRVKQLNPTANKFHSFDAARGKGLPEATTNGSTPNGSRARTPSGNLAVVPEAPVSRSLSSSSVIITKEDIRQVGDLLSGTHITESEMNLRALELQSRKLGQKDETAPTVDMTDANKRDRPESMRQLVQQAEKAPQRKRQDEDSASVPLPPANEKDDKDDEEAGEGSGDNDEDNDAPQTKRWTKLQDNALRESVRIHGEKNWKAIAEMVPGRNHAQCLQRWRKVLKPGLVKGHWSFEEDQMLEFLVTQGCNNWGQIAERIPGRTPKQCRERWKNHLDPAINKGPYTEEEDKIILDAQEKLGNRWSQIAQLLKGRTEDSVKIRWKSLKQNPAKAAASHAQQKKAQQHHQHAAYQQNPALMRQLMRHQQQVQHSEAAQLEQQQLQQQHLQMRLHERVMQQQRAGGLPPPLLDSTGLPLKHDPSIVDVSAGLHSSDLYPSTHVDHGYDYSSSNFSYMAAMASSSLPDHGAVPHPNAQSWDVHESSSVPVSEAYSNVQPAYWDHYGKPQGGALPEPIPLSSGMLPDPSHGLAYGVGVAGAPEDEVYNEPVMEKFATEFHIGGMGMGGMGM